MVATLLFTAQTAIWIRSLVQSPTETVPKPKASTPITSAHFLAWGSIATATLAATLWSTHSGGPASLAAQMALPFNLAATVLAYLIGSQVPKHLHGIFHPVLVTAVLAHVAVVFHGSLRGLSFDAAQVVYLNKGTHGMTPGAGDALMNVLGMVIVSFGLRIYTQRKIMKRHATEILGTTALSALFSMFSTALAAKALGLNGALARALVPRSVTVALAVPIARQLNASVAITAAAVLLQGLLGANFGPNLMTMIGVRDVIARGMAAAATAGGLGTAAIAAKEPEALPFCALSYSMIGIMSTCFAAVPPIMNALVAVLPP
nr:plastidal glycolate glycerate translocator (PLGG) [Polytomella parva]|eukprot:CAMPEP_0175053348 /NCGR_PEP_ID=MMETSP0052_2-20121109/8872_1 /TAXON_ID=51329 ORGANISM="Polytomella parva, Strain SAG 63-3" /NCGR_SAMPLE_ID=MMETSP0052_2 /ASSEMBLY_ACC=CAM_ASM_000194 /LENGTH=317 /DNA_ID=CAMNT_0016317867 /DNA_START=566 /DNA_END=1519 /DNA_ORIENTATION=-